MGWVARMDALHVGTRVSGLVSTLALTFGCGSVRDATQAAPDARGGVENSAAGNENTGGNIVTAGGGGSGGLADTGGGGALAVGGQGGSAVLVREPFINYQLTGTWPELEAAIAQAPGALSYTKIQVSDLFLAESCAIADYNGDGQPDISAGRRWYEGPAFTTEHIFRDGHDALPRDGLIAELDTGVSDDQSDFAWDVNGDGFADIINISNPDVPADKNPSPAPAPQPTATAYWYENPAGGWELDPKWTPHLIHGDVRQEQRGIADVDGDGLPEIFGACKTCMPNQTKGYYSGDWNDPERLWTYTAVTPTFEFPFGGVGVMTGLGFGDVNGDGRPDMLDRVGAWLQDAEGGSWQLLAQTMYDGSPEQHRGGAHMYAWDIDGDGDQDTFSADWAHGYGLAWYEQAPGGLAPFIKHYFVGTPEEAATYGLSFSQPHAAQVVDMDGDGIADIVTGKTHFANPHGCGDPDNGGTPVLYVFKTVRDQPGVSGKAHFEPILVGDTTGVGRQIAVGHANLDGIMDICVATKLGIYVFLGQ
jgi:hypothetical protein